MEKQQHFYIVFNLAILALYLNQQLIYNQNQSTAIYHVNDFILHSATILGAILADSFIGLYKTLLIMTLTFAVGSFILMIAAMDISLLAMRLITHSSDLIEICNILRNI